MSDGYAGDITPIEAWKLLNEDAGAVLVDVRTSAEWSYVGLPDLGSLGKQPAKIAWQLFPEMRVNPDFLEAVGVAGIKPARYQNERFRIRGRPVLRRNHHPPVV